METASAQMEHTALMEHAWLAMLLVQHVQVAITINVLVVKTAHTWTWIILVAAKVAIDHRLMENAYATKALGGMTKQIRALHSHATLHVALVKNLQTLVLDV